MFKLSNATVCVQKTSQRSQESDNLRLRTQNLSQPRAERLSFLQDNTVTADIIKLTQQLLLRHFRNFFYQISVNILYIYINFEPR